MATEHTALSDEALAEAFAKADYMVAWLDNTDVLGEAGLRNLSDWRARREALREEIERRERRAVA